MPAEIRAQRGEELHVTIGEGGGVGGGAALHDHRAERALFAEDGDGEERREALLLEDGEVLVERVGAGVVHRDGPQVLHRLARDALADVQADLPQRAPREADVAAHDELALALEEVERADGGAERRRDASRGLVEQGDQGHGARGEGHEIQHGVEPLVAALVDLGPHEGGVSLVRGRRG